MNFIDHNIIAFESNRSDVMTYHTVTSHPPKGCVVDDNYPYLSVVELSSNAWSHAVPSSINIRVLALWICMRWTQCLVRSSVILLLHDQLIWVSDCLMFNAKQLCSYIMARASYVSMIWWWRHLSTLEWILFVLAHWNTSSRIDMSLHSSTLWTLHASHSKQALICVLFVVLVKQINV
jgi:hypothetical protein